ncbi:MAG: hypothetical protein GDA56_13615 [Hormoscilla sp. GM7CHS1pb]|nr:hypothetical protein [Hormoscilla sp. GM7CHS1pb]
MGRRSWHQIKKPGNSGKTGFLGYRVSGLPVKSQEEIEYERSSINGICEISQ